MAFKFNPFTGTFDFFKNYGLTNVITGSAVLTSGEATINNSSITSNSLIFVTPKNIGDLEGTLRTEALANQAKVRSYDNLNSVVTTDSTTFDYFIIL